MIAPLQVAAVLCALGVMLATVLQLRRRATPRGLRQGLLPLFALIVLAVSGPLFGGLASWLLAVVAVVVLALYLNGLPRLIDLRDGEAFSALEVRLASERAARARAEAELRTTRIALLRSTMEAEQYTAMVPADLQAPLRSVAGFSQLLSRRYRARLDREALEFLDYIEQGTGQLQARLRDLRMLARVGNGPLRRLERRPLAETIGRALSALRTGIDRSGTEVVVGPLPEIEADHGLLALLFRQLFDNSIRFARPGTRPRITLSLMREGEDWRIDVADNGIGVPEAQLEYVFGIFHRLRADPRETGTGIGLAICRRIAARHGGEIWASTDDDGLCIHLRLPVAPGAVIEAPCAEAA